MSKRILDFDYQLFRLFGHHIFDYDQQVGEQQPRAHGVYDIIFSHREGIQDRFDELKTYTKPSTHLIVDSHVCIIYSRVIYTGIRNVYLYYYYY